MRPVRPVACPIISGVMPRNDSARAVTQQIAVKPADYFALAIPDKSITHNASLYS